MQSDKLPSVNIVGTIFGSSGYSNHVKGIANALSNYLDVSLTTQAFPGWELHCNDAELKMCKTQDNKERINLIVDLPFNWSRYLIKKYNICYLVWEGDKIPISWLDNIADKRVSQVWVPSMHTYDAIKNTMLEANWETQVLMNKIKLVPHGVDLSIFQPHNNQSKIFTFLVNKGFRGPLDRGGMQHAIRAFIQEFNKGEAELMLKLNPAYALHPNQLNAFIGEELKLAGKDINNMPMIRISYANASQVELCQMYNDCDVLLNPTEGESFSLPCIEAMACGKPVITTNYGGQTDFVNNKNGWLINYNLHEVKHEIMYEGINWATPNIEELKATMRKVYQNRAELNEKGRCAYDISLYYSWDNTAKKAVNYIQAVVAVT